MVVKEMSLNVGSEVRYRLKLIRENLLQNESLHSFAKRHNYCSSAINLLENSYINFDTSTELLLQSNSVGYNHYKDNRSCYDFNLNLIAGWVVEDFIVDKSNSLLRLNGCDKDRQILKNKVTNEADLITYKNIPIEVHTEYFSRKAKLHKRKNGICLRDNKYLNLKNKDAFLLIINVADKTYILKKIKDFTVNCVREEPKFGGKLVTELTLNNIYSEFKPLSNLFYLFDKSAYLRAQKETI